MRGHRRRSLLPDTPPRRGHRISPVVLVRRAFSHVARHALLYAVVAAIAIAVQWIVYRQSNAAAAYIGTSGVVIDAIIATIVFAQAKGDIDGWATNEVWSRILERLWAVIIVDFITTFVGVFGVELLGTGDLSDRILAIPILLIAAATVFSEAIAVVADGERWWFLVVRAIGESIRTALRGGTLWRAIVLFSLQFVPVVLSSAMTAASGQHHTTVTSFWTDVPLGIIYAIPLDALIVLAFFDASGYEPKHTCGE